MPPRTTAFTITGIDFGTGFTLTDGNVINQNGGAILVDMQATGKEEAIREIVASLNQAGCLPTNDLESVSRAILGREELGSTGIGRLPPDAKLHKGPMTLLAYDLKADGTATLRIMMTSLQ